jgi:hypothetical protein
LNIFFNKKPDIVAMIFWCINKKPNPVKVGINGMFNSLQTMEAAIDILNVKEKTADGFVSNIIFLSSRCNLICWKPLN